MLEALGLILSTGNAKKKKETNPRIVAFVCNPSTLEAQGSGIKGQPQLCMNFKASLGYLTPCLK